jgi:Uma2 family endonuclease
LLSEERNRDSAHRSRERFANLTYFEHVMTYPATPAPSLAWVWSRPYTLFKMLASDKLTWEDVCSDQSLRDLPFKIELNRLNQIVMSPAHPWHSRLQSKIARMLGDLLSDGEAIVELAIETEDSTKVPDVVWASKATIARRSGETSWLSAPEVCVEVLSPANTTDEMDKKLALYFERGASEVWLCSCDGNMTFYGPEGKLKSSKFCPMFPDTIVL